MPQTTTTKLGSFLIKQEATAVLSRRVAVSHWLQMDCSGSVGRFFSAGTFKEETERQRWKTAFERQQAEQPWPPRMRSQIHSWALSGLSHVTPQSLEGLTSGRWDFRGEGRLPHHWPSCLHLRVFVCFLIKEVTSSNYFNLCKLRNLKETPWRGCPPSAQSAGHFQLWGVILQRSCPLNSWAHAHHSKGDKALC